MNRVFRRLIAFVVVLSCLTPLKFAAAQQKVGNEFLPADAMATAVMHPAKMLKSESLKLYPTEIANAWVWETVGVPLEKVEKIRVVVATPRPADAMFGAVFHFNEDVGIDSLTEQFIGPPVDIAGKKCFSLNGPPGVVLHQLESDTIVLASASYLEKMLEAKEGGGNGALAQYAGKMTDDAHLTILFAVEPVRPLINGLIATVIEQLPPPLLEFTDLPNLLDAVALKVDVDKMDEGLTLALLGRDVESAEEMQQIIDNGLAMGRQMTMLQIAGSMQGEGTVPDAMRRYMDRMADKVVDAMTPNRNGRVLTLKAPLNYGMYTQMMMMGFLMPAVQRAEFVADQARGSNNLKMIGLAMHNHHSAFKELPDSAIRDEEGKPLLSWRVKLLPFLEEMELYNEFHLDEPWDSEHNIKLVKRMPAVYAHPRVGNDGGRTHYLAPIHEDQCMFNEEGSVRFRDVLDGLSNTAMVVEVNEDTAVEWTKPADWEVDMDNPFEGLLMEGNQFQILISDGSVRSLTKDLGADMMKAILTIAGAEVVDF